MLGDGSCAKTRAIAEKRVRDIEMRLHDLKSIHTTLEKLIHTWRAGNRPLCPIIASLERNPD